MENFALQASPYSFVKLRISPWESPSVFLLCSLLSWCLSFLLFTRPSLYLTLLFPLSLPHAAARAGRRLAASGDGALGALLPQAGGAWQACTGAGERLCAGVGKRAGAARELVAGGARAAQPAQERRPSRRGSAQPQVWSAAAAWQRGWIARPRRARAGAGARRQVRAGARRSAGAGPGRGRVARSKHRRTGGGTGAWKRA
jgi:hypothetical protein